VVAPDGKAVSRRDVMLAGSGDPATQGDDAVTLSDGVRAGETVVVAGVHSLKDGQAVRLRSSGL
jgi:multidrug efflux pump subunit AcrA (membrane-fusion protein)